MLSSDRALAHYDVNRPVKLFCDASAYGLGACLVHIMDDGSQKPLHMHHLHFPSLNEHMLRAECEGLALVFGVRHFHQYLYGCPFILLQIIAPSARFW